MRFHPLEPRLARLPRNQSRGQKLMRKVDRVRRQSLDSSPRLPPKMTLVTSSEDFFNSQTLQAGIKYLSCLSRKSWNCNRILIRLLNSRPLNIPPLDQFAFHGKTLCPRNQLERGSKGQHPSSQYISWFQAVLDD